ncbi:hypothetical protein [Hymenobacter sp. CRA2]|uniref:hypothetical protein n=1 Tax=Hymenobacter sp. CRA2 TaxID=1955620 RepID=UPI00098F5FA1|nr:hypothetical protein [Hymenobacter sp. CRA2]OON68877.1 hypothetical protein B0919_11945 [Hymenobacter sp. CRA2]
MTRILQRLFTGLLIVLLLGGIGNIILGVPADLADRSVTEDWGGVSDALLLRERVEATLWLLPWAALLGVTVWSIRYQRPVLFYWALLVGLSLLQVLPLMAVVAGRGTEPVWLYRFIVGMFGLLLLGQLTAVWQLIRLYRRGAS